MSNDNILNPEYEDCRRTELHCNAGSYRLFGDIDAVKNAFESGCKAAAVIERCSVMTLPPAARTARAIALRNRESGRSIRIISGAEMLIRPDTESAGNGEMAIVEENMFPVILLAKNATGLKNLYKLISLAHTEYKDSEMVLPRSVLEEYRDGFLVGAAANGGEVSRGILAGKPADKLAEAASHYDYLEITNYDEKKIKKDATVYLNMNTLELGEKTGVPAVAVSDPGHSRDGCGKRIASTGEMLEAFSYLGEKAYEAVVRNPDRIASQIDALDPVPRGNFFPAIEDADHKIRALAYEKAGEIYGETLPEAVRKRLEFELGNIIGNGESGIYLGNLGIAANARSEGNPVSFRGRIGSSLVAYLIGLTEIDPLPAHYVCPVCRHYEEPDAEPWIAGPDLPERDCPVCRIRMRRKGFHLPAVTLFGLKGDRLADIDLMVPEDYQERAKSSIREVFRGSQTVGAGKIDDGIVQADESGVFVIPEGMEIYDFTPVQFPDDPDAGTKPVTQFNWMDLDYSLLKMDIIGDKSLQMIKDLERRTGIKQKDIPLDDRRALSGISSEEGTNGIPVFDDDTFRDIVQTIKPQTVSGLIKCCGLMKGVDTWNESVKARLQDSDADLGSIIASREDIYTNSIKGGVDNQEAFKTMETARKRRYLSNRAQDAAMAVTGIRLAWFREHCPEEFKAIQEES